MGYMREANSCSAMKDPEPLRVRNRFARSYPRARQESPLLDQETDRALSDVNVEPTFHLLFFGVTVSTTFPRKVT